MRRKDTRLLMVDRDAWEYKIGRIHIAMYAPDGKRYFPTIVDIVGYKAFDQKSYQLNPAVLVEYIQRVILGDKDKVYKCKHCHRVKEDVRLRFNPYEGEINLNNVKEFICDSCYEQLEFDI